MQSKENGISELKSFADMKILIKKSILLQQLTHRFLTVKKRKKMNSIFAILLIFKNGNFNKTHKKL